MWKRYKKNEMNESVLLLVTVSLPKHCHFRTLLKG